MKTVIRDIEDTISRLRQQRLRVHVPPSVELFRRVPNAYFHPTPELFFQTGGGTDFDCPGDKFRLRAGDVCVMPSGVSHAETPVDLKTPYSILVFMQIREGINIHRAIASEARQISAVQELRCNTSHSRRVFRYLEEISLSGRIARKNRKRYIHSLLEAALLTILGEASCGDGEASAHSTLVEEVEKLARIHLSDPNLSVAHLAKMLGCSSEHLSRRFRLERGCTLTEWITGQRITLAKELLADPRCNIAEVGWACGFNAPSYFIRVFHQKTGATPRVYRQLKS